MKPIICSRVLIVLVIFHLGYSKSEASRLSLPYNGWLPAINVVDNYIYLSDYSTGLSVIEIGENSLQLTQIHDRQQEIQYLLPIESGTMYAYYGSDTLASYSISDPLSPIINLPGYRSDIGMPYGMLVRDSFLYLAGNHPFGGESFFETIFEIVDFSSPIEPQTLFSHQATAGAGGIAFVPDSPDLIVVSEAGLISWNIADTQNPYPIDTLEVSTDYIVSWQGILFLRNGSLGYAMTSIDSVGHFTEVRSGIRDFFSGYNFQLLCAGSQYLIGYENGSILIFETLSEDQPVLRSSFLQDNVRKLFTNDDVLISSTNDSLFVYHLSEVVSVDEKPKTIPDSFDLLRVYPNPFNSTANLIINLPFPGDFNLDVSNVLGQVVWSIDLNDHIPGSYKFAWNGNSQDGKPLTSGIYFVRISGDNLSETLKAVLLK